MVMMISQDGFGCCAASILTLLSVTSAVQVLMLTFRASLEGLGKYTMKIWALLL